MKKIFFLLALLPVIVSAQYAPNNNSVETSRIAVNNTLSLPSGCGVPSGAATLRGGYTNRPAAYFDTCGHKLYIWDNSISSWKSLSFSDSTIWATVTKVKNDSTLLRGFINALISDSAYQASQIALRVKYSDTAAMLNPGYPRTNRFLDSIYSIRDLANTRITKSDADTYYPSISRTLDSLAALRSANAAKLNITDAASTYPTITRFNDTATAIHNRIQTKEPLIAAGTTGQYWRGDKSWQTLDKTAVGLGNVDNTSDANKPISTATQTALDGKVPTSRTINGYALTSNISLNKSDVGLSNVPNTDATNATNITSGTLPDARLSANVTVQGNTFNSANQLVKLDGSGKLPTSTIPSLALVETFVVGSQAAMLALSAQMGDVAVRTDNNRSYILQSEPASTLSNWVQLLVPDSETDPVYTASSWFSTTNNASNWNTAYSWGNHASAGYAMASRTITINGTAYDLSANRSWTVGDVRTDGSYSNPSWITSLAWSKLTGVPSTFTPSAHNHSISDITSLQAYLDGKLNLSGGTLTGALNGTIANFTDGSSTTAALNINASIYPAIHLNSSDGNSSNRNWRISGVQSSYGLFEITSSTTAGGAPLTPRLAISGINGKVFINTTTASGVTGSAVVIRPSSSNEGQSAIVIKDYNNIDRWAINGQSGVSTYNYTIYSAPTGTNDYTKVFEITQAGVTTLSSTLYYSGELYNNTNNGFLRGRNSANSAYIAAIGINTSNKVSVDPDGNGVVIGGNTIISGTITASALAKSGGTSSQALIADGSVLNIAAANTTGALVQRDGNGDFNARTIGLSGDLTVNTVNASLVRSTGDVIAYYTSDRRLKKNIKPIENALEKLSRLSGNEYDWDEAIQNTYKGHDYGVIAQEIESVLPGTTHLKPDGFFGIKNQNQIMALLIQAVKELKHEVDQLKKR